MSKSRAHPVAERFWSHVNTSGDCWPWTASVDEHGYGRFIVCEGRMRAHRVSFVLSRGPIPRQMCVLHRCDNPQCVNPDHLFLGTNLENIADRHSKGRTARGETFPTAKLTKLQVVEILNRHRKLHETPNTLGKMFGVEASTIRHIVRGDNWKEFSCQAPARTLVELVAEANLLDGLAGS